MTEYDDNGSGSGSEWLRLLFMLLFFVILFYVMKLVVTVIVVVQFLFRLVSGQTNDRLLAFSDSLSRYGHEVLEYVTYVSDRRPFPFSDWPSRRPDPAGGESPPGPGDDTD